MYIGKVSLRNYRNVKHADFICGKGINVLVGDNGQGKTNTIEALLLALSGRSHRESLSENFIGPAADKASVEVDLRYSDDSSYEVCLSLSPQGKRYTVNEEPVRRRLELLRQFSLVFFCPEDLRLVKDGPAVRRDFLNESIGMLAPAYGAALADYNRVLKQRAALLREYSPSSLSLMEVYDESLAKSGSALIRYRIKFLREFEKHLNIRYQEIAGGRETLTLSYVSDLFAAGIPKQLEQAYQQALSKTRAADIAARTNMVGAHRDDVALFLNGKNARRFASQGQQRSIALCMKLSLISLIYEKNKEMPIVLLDDVMSELDDARQRQILSLVKGTQTFITCVNEEFLKYCTNAAVFRVKDGAINKENQNGNQ